MVRDFFCRGYLLVKCTFSWQPQSLKSIVQFFRILTFGFEQCAKFDGCILLQPLHEKLHINITATRKKIKLVSPRPPLLNADMVWYKKVIKLKGIQQTTGSTFLLIIYVTWTLQDIFLP